MPFVSEYERRSKINKALTQLAALQLKRIIEHEGWMLLTGQVYQPEEKCG